MAAARQQVRLAQGLSGLISGAGGAGSEGPSHDQQKKGIHSSVSSFSQLPGARELQAAGVSLSGLAGRRGGEGAGEGKQDGTGGEEVPRYVDSDEEEEDFFMHEMLAAEQQAAELEAEAKSAPGM